MITPELLINYDFFSGLDNDYVSRLAEIAEEVSIDGDTYIFKEGDDILKLYLIVEGTVAIILELSGRTSDDKTTEVSLNTIGACDVFGYSALIPPHTASVSCKSLTPCKIISFDGEALLSIFKEDCRFGYMVLQRIAILMRERINIIQSVSLAYMMD
jgi:CRP/FNR family cyclic AMP-dependent transcriptional regulator